MNEMLISRYYRDARVLSVGGGADEVMCEVVEHNRAAKVTAYKKKPRNTYRRKLGHRQHQTVVRITDIVAK